MFAALLKRRKSKCSTLPLTEAPGSICILRLSSLGDVCHVVPVVRAIQAQWPQTKITWICGLSELRFVSSIEGVRSIPLDRQGGFAAYRQLWADLKDEHFDVLLHMQTAIKAGVASVGINAPIRLGWDANRSRELHRLFINTRVPEARNQHQVLAFFSFAKSIGIRADGPAWDLPISDLADNTVRRRLNGADDLLVISPGSRHPLRNWTASYYAEVADYAARVHGMNIIICGGISSTEVALATDIQQRMTEPVTNLVGKDTLPECLALLKRARLVITPDSGPLHIADALGSPVVGLHACTPSARSGPFHWLDYCVDHYEDAARDYLGKAAGALRWGKRIEFPGVMSMVKPAEVTHQIDRILTATNP